MPIMASLALGPTVAMRRGNEFVVPHAASLPANCVKCGAPASTPWRKKFYWHTPWLYIMILFPGLLIYAIVAIIVRKKMELNVPLCDSHHADRKRYVLLAALMLIGFVPVGLILGANFSEALGWVTGALMFVAGLVFAIMTNMGLRPSKIDDTAGVFRGANVAFLSLLPEQQVS